MYGHDKLSVHCPLNVEIFFSMQNPDGVMEASEEVFMQVVLSIENSLC